MIMATANGDSLHRSALVVYGSETGNAQDVAEEVGRLCERLRFATRVAELDAISLKQLLQPTLVLFIISTTGQGELPANARKFWKALRSARLPPGCLHRLHFTSFGLGDSSYPQFNWAHRKLSNRLLRLGARPICDRAESDERHPEGIDGAFIPWLLQLRQRLLETSPLPDDLETIPDDVLLEPKWILEQASAQSLPIAIGNIHHLPLNGHANGVADTSGGIEATISTNNRITPTSHWQDVRQLTLNLAEKVDYMPGDVLTIYPKNFPVDVEHFLSTSKWSEVADLPVKFCPTDRALYQKDPSAYPSPPVASLTHATFTLRGLLMEHLDIMSIPRRSFFSNLIHYTTDELHVERLKEFTNPEFIDELFDYTTRPRRSILEVLDEFTSVKIPWQKICTVIPAMRGRQFSIASGGALKSGTEHQNGPEMPSATRVELLIAIVKYRTIIKRIREGVCTRYVASLQPGQRITVTLQKGGLQLKQSDLGKPVIMIGPGTGVAPMRSLIYERLFWRKQQGLPDDAGMNNCLFFGCRNEHSDYFFKDEWSRLQEKGSMTAYVAFSRDQRQKVYVQDLVRQQSSTVFRALAEKGGMVYICGSSGKMPQAVREALIEVFQEQGQMAREDAEGYLARMEKEGRYKQETW